MNNGHPETQEMSTPSINWEQEVKDRQEFRCQMVRGFGFTVMDHGVALTICPKCSCLCAVNSAFPDSDWNSLYHMLSVLETFVETRQCRIKCSSCKTNISLEGKRGNREYWLWHSHFLPEIKQDLQLLIKRQNGSTGWIEGMLIDEGNAITPIALPSSEADFSSHTGCYFSLRQVWKEFLQQHWPIKSFAQLMISPGYFLIANPPVEDDHALQEFKENCVKLLTASPSVGTQFEFADLSWADSWNFEENTYHQWLSDFENDLEESNLIAGVLASPEHYFQIIQAEVEPFGCRLTREDERTHIAVLGDEEYYISFDYREYLVNAMIKGYGYWGALRYVEPILDAWERARDAGQRLREMLKSYKCTVYGGHHFQCRLKRGKKIIAEFDLLSLSEPEDELEDDSEFLEWIAPQIALNPKTLTFETGV